MSQSKDQERKRKGQAGEDQACEFLINQGFDIIERNYRYKRAEIDVIALKDKLLLFAEVKFRKANSYGYPEEFVSENQQKLIVEAADDYISNIHWKGNIRFDIIAIDSRHAIEHFEDAFY